MSEENIAIRLKFLIENLGLTSSQFADRCDIARPTLSQLLTGRNKKISNLIIEQIHTAYPGLSITWLLFGEGDMWSSNNGKEIDEDDSESTHIDATTTKDNPKEPINPHENAEKRNAVQHSFAESKENAVNATQNAHVNSNYENVNSSLDNVDILTKIEKKCEKPRKVVQVTIYYDDSTFQTFYPK